MSCGVALRRSSDLALLWLWCRPAATALTRPLAWEPPYATGAARKRQKDKKKKKEFKVNLGLAKGKLSGREKMGGCGWHIYRVGNLQGATV